MKTKYILIVAILMELILTAMLPYSLYDYHISITPAFFLVVLIISQRQYSILDNLITCIVSTMTYSYIFNLPIMVTTLLYTLLFFISKIWSKNISDSYIELTVLSVAIVFVKDWIIHLIRYMVYDKKINLLQVLSNRITPTVIATFIITFIFTVVYQMYLDYRKVKVEMGRRNENIYVFDYLNNKYKKHVSKK